MWCDELYIYIYKCIYSIYVWWAWVQTAMLIFLFHPKSSVEYSELSEEESLEEVLGDLFVLAFRNSSFFFALLGITNMGISEIQWHHLEKGVSLISKGPIAYLMFLTISINFAKPMSVQYIFSIARVFAVAFIYIYIHIFVHVTGYIWTWYLQIRFINKHIGMIGISNSKKRIS